MENNYMAFEASQPSRQDYIKANISDAEINELAMACAKAAASPNADASMLLMSYARTLDGLYLEREKYRKQALAYAEQNGYRYAKNEMGQTVYGAIIPEIAKAQAEGEGPNFGSR